VAVELPKGDEYKYIDDELQREKEEEEEHQHRLDRVRSAQLNKDLSVSDKKALEVEARKIREEQAELQRKQENRLKDEKIRQIKEEQARLKEAQGGTLRPKKEKFYEDEKKVAYVSSFKPSKEEDDEHEARLRRIASSELTNSTKVQETAADRKKKVEEERRKREEERKIKEEEDNRIKQEKIAEIARSYQSQMESVKDTVPPPSAHKPTSSELSKFMPSGPAPKPGAATAKPKQVKPVAKPKPAQIVDAKPGTLVKTLSSGPSTVPFTPSEDQDLDEAAKREEARLFRAFANKRKV